MSYVQFLPNKYVFYFDSCNFFVHLNSTIDPLNIVFCVLLLFITCIFTVSQDYVSDKSQPPSEDKYAALKDLDCLMKSQTQQPAESSNTSVVEWGNF